MRVSVLLVTLLGCSCTGHMDGKDDGAGATGSATHTSSGQSGTGAAAPIPDPPSDNPIDVAVWPRVYSGGRTSIVVEAPEILC